MEFSFEAVNSRFYTNEDISLIANTHIGIAGCGGLGSNCASYLVRAGFNTFTLIDFDIVEESNLNRQFFFHKQIGAPKAESLADNLRQINPDLQLKIHKMKIDESNIVSLFECCDYVVEAVDGAKTKALIATNLLKQNKTIISASGMAGIGKSDEIIVRKLKKNFYIVGDMKSDVEKGLLPYAPRVAVCAAKQTDLILELTLKTNKL